MYLHYTISLVIPCLNEEEALKKILPKIPSYVDEVIVVDNNSTDHTGAVAKKLGAKVIFEKKRGYGSAIKTGIRNAKKDLIVIIDGDGTYSPSDSKRLVGQLHKNNLDFISGNRFNGHFRNRIHTVNLLGNILLTVCTRLLFFKNIGDSQSGMMIIKRSIAHLLKTKSSGMSFSEEIKLEAMLNQKIKFGEYPITYKGKNRIGQKKLRLWRDGFENLRFLFVRRFSRKI